MTTPKSVRYCIRCGAQIDAAMHCPNPDCAGIPNFYRDVPGPEHGGRPRSAPTPPRTVPMPAAGSTPPGAPPAVDADRRTIQLSAPPVAHLESTTSPAERHAIVPGANEVGAHGGAAIRIDRPQVSSRHAVIDCRHASGGAWRLTIVDRGSTNGTWVNGERIRERALAPEDRVRFADVEFIVRVPRSEEPRMTVQLS